VSQTREGQPDKLRRRLRGDLDNIVLKALQKEPQRRYDSVAEFSQDIGRHLQHLPVKARPSTLVYRVSKFVQRHRIEASAAGIVLLVFAAGASFAFNTLGLRDRLLGGAAGTWNQPQNGPQSLNPQGWVAIAGASTKPAVPCESLASLKLPDTTVTLTQSVPGGAVTPPSGEPIQSVPPFCRVQGEIKPTSDSDIQFEVWMPSLGWNRKFRGAGNFGFAGVLNFDDMAPAVRSGYATASTNTGHIGGKTDSNWALGHPEKLVDLGYRGVHEMTEKAKAIIRAYYGQTPQWSFFEGCSNGGREALMEAQRFPGDYHGILAGAPALFATRLLAMDLYNTGASPPGYIPASKIPAISAAVLTVCDAEDGVSDGILNDPRRCHFDPSVLRCRGAEADNCLNPAQVAQLKKIYAGLQNSKGEQLFPGYMPGGEEGEDGWAGYITGPAPGEGGMFTFGLNYFRGMVFGDPAWDYRKVSAERAVRIADEKTARTMNATDPDLRPFKARGGKLILYHGWSDSGIPAMSTINYYDSVAARMGSHETDDFVRLYMAPGMQHCFEGPGPNSFGQFDFSSFGAGAQQVARGTDPQHSVSSALEQWVENGVAPGPIIATKYVNDLDPSQGVKMTRPLCPYPQIAKYKGSGNTNDATNFVCTDNE
jgi:hypothetical protein